MRAMLVFGLLTLLASCLPVTARSRPAPSTREVADADLGARVALALYDAEVPGWSGVRVTARAGRVTLEGEVPDARARERAVAAAEAVAGVGAVDARLEVPTR